MTGNPPSDDDLLPPALGGLVARMEGAAWVVDPASARVVAASAEGASRLGMAQPDVAMALDAAMPAVRRLRDIASALAPGGETLETLLLWTRGGAERIACHISRPAEAPTLLLVRAANERATDVVGEPAAEAAPAARPRSDAETLREIARRIREGARGAVPGASAAAAYDGDDRASSDDSQHPEPRIDIAKLAHELRTPLGAIIAASEIMRDERLGAIGNERYRGYASDIHDSARHALAVINSMLGRSAAGAATGTGRREAAEPQLFAQLDLNAIVEGTVSGMRPLADKAAVAVSALLRPRLPNVIADPVSVRQILLNLLTNAVKFTAGGGTVTVTTRYALDGPVEIVVADTGAGMSAADIARSLSADAPPQRAPREGGGLGIGLPLVRLLAEANGATIAIDSAPGAGTAVVVAFAKNRVVPV